MTAVGKAGPQQGAHIGDAVPADVERVAVQLHDLVISGKCLRDKVVVIAVVFLLGVTDDVDIGVLGHSQPEAVSLPTGQQTRHTGAMDGCDDPILRFELAFRKVQPAFGVHDVGLRSVEHDDTADFPGHRAPVLEVPGMGRIRHGGRMVGHSQRAVADFLSGCGHFRKSIVCVRCAQGMRVQVCDHLHGMKKPLFTL